MDRYDLVTVVGPTASGKTGFACQLAQRIGGEIISGDSRQVYRSMDIGTGKDLADYTVQGEKIPYHLIDICAAGDKYNIFEYQHDFHKVYKEIQERGRIPIFCGGSGLYMESVLKGYLLADVPKNKELRDRYADYSLAHLEAILATYKGLHNKTDVDTAKRAIRAIEIAEYQQNNPLETNKYAPLNTLLVGIDIERNLRREKITARLHARLQEGMIEEVRGLLDSGLKAEDLIYYGLEYKYVTLYICNELSYSEMLHQLEIAIHQFAKRQMTWFRGMETRGLHIHWIDSELPTSHKIEMVQGWMGK